MRVKTYLKIALFFWLSALFSLPVMANSTPPDPAKKCVMCHKKENAKMQGLHAQALNPHDNTAVNCTNCHKAIDPEAKVHPQNRSNITQYRPLYHAFVMPKDEAAINNESDDKRIDKNADTTPLAIKQNEQCMSCHTPETLRASFWPHDVHATTLSCSDCHKVHPAADPVIGLNETKKVDLCLDCHAAQSVKTPSVKQETQP